MKMSARNLPGYHTHTMRTRLFVVQAELRYCWDILALLRRLLLQIEEGGGPSAVRMFPGEHHKLAALAQKTCVRARKLLDDVEPLWADPEPEAELRETYLAKATCRREAWQPPPWHAHALGAIRELAAVPKFVELAIEPGRFDMVPRGVEPDGAEEG